MVHEVNLAVLTDALVVEADRALTDPSGVFAAVSVHRQYPRGKEEP